MSNPWLEVALRDGAIGFQRAGRDRLFVSGRAPAGKNLAVRHAFPSEVAAVPVGLHLPDRRGAAALLTIIVALLVSRAIRAENLLPFCPSCQLQIGVGETYHFWGRTGGVVVPLTVDWDGNRYEFGAFRISTRQTQQLYGRGPDHVTAQPYWGFSLTRRWQLLHVWSTRLVLGVGASYKTETDDLNSTHWNFAETLGARFQLTGGSAIELSIRHWSNAGLRLPNRGQDFMTMPAGEKRASWVHVLGDAVRSTGPASVKRSICASGGYTPNELRCRLWRFMARATRAVLRYAGLCCP
jgi:hypothetical protein